MQLKIVDVDQARGKRLAHNVVDDAGRKILRKGIIIGPPEHARLRRLGYTQVWVAELGAEDIPEDEVARRLATAICGPGTGVSSLSVGRANIQAQERGILKVDTRALYDLNAIPGLALATHLNHSRADRGHVVATFKVVPYAMSREQVVAAEQIAVEAGGILSVQPFKPMKVGILLTGLESSADRLRRVFGTVIRQRVEEVGSTVVDERFVTETVPAIARALRQLVSGGVNLIVMAGETSIVDVDDRTPRAVREAGGHIEVYGVPVDPGNLLMLAYIDGIPVVGAPGCIRSRQANVVDLVFPRLLAGEHLAREDILQLGHGGLVA